MTAHQNEEGELQLRHYLTVLWRRKFTILGSMVALAIVGWLLGGGLVESYTSTAQVLAKPVTTTVSSGSAGTAREVAVIADEVAIMSSDKVLGAIQDEVDHPIVVEFLPQGAETRTASNVVSITVTGEQESVQKDAQDIAEAYVAVRRAALAQSATTAAAELTNRIAELDTQLAEVSGQLATLDAQIAAATDPGAVRALETQRTDLLPERDSVVARRSASEQQLDEITLTSAVNPTLGVDVLTGASDPALLAGPSRTQYGSAGLALGLIVGVLLAFAREYFDPSVRTTRDVTPGVRVLGVVQKHSQGASV